VPVGVAPRDGLLHLSKGEIMRICDLESCERPHYGRGLCRTHLRQTNEGKIPGAIREYVPGRTGCGSPGCDKPHHGKGLCRTHYKRVQRGGQLGPLLRQGTGWVDKNGYRMVSRKDHPNASEAGVLAEHRLVMSETLARPLFPGENVHHVNGVRDDNRPENLELWVSYQPSGQRPADLLEWAHEIIRRYGDDPCTSCS